MIKKIILIALSLLLALSTSSTVYANTEFYQSQNILFYNGLSNNDMMCGSASSVETQNKQSAYLFFLDSGIAKAQSAAIVGVLSQASGSTLDPKALDSDGDRYGVAQWSGQRRDALEDFSTEKSLDISDLKTQLQFIITELTSSQKSIYDSLKTSRTVAEAVTAFSSFVGVSIHVGSAETIANSLLSAAISTVDCFVFYSQKDPKWGDILYDQNYPSSRIYNVGCGPTSAAMLVATLVDKTVTPDIVAAEGAKRGSYINGRGTAHWPLWTAVSERWGLNFKDISSKPIEDVVAALKAGNYIYMGGAGPAPFTETGHIVVIKGLDSSGNFIVADPWREDNTPYSQALIDTHRGTTFVISKGTR